MNHYSKLSIILFRILGSLLMLLGFMGLAYWLFADLLLEPDADPISSARGLSAVIFLLVGLIIYYLGKPIGRIISKDIKD